MSDEIDVKLCIGICELKKFSSTVPTHEATLVDYKQNYLEATTVKNYIEREESKRLLPIANPYIAAYLIIIGEQTMDEKIYMQYIK